LPSHTGWLESAIAATVTQSGVALTTFVEGFRERQ